MSFTNEVIKKKFQNKFTAACYNGKLDVAKQLLKDHPDIDIFAENGLSLKITFTYLFTELSEWLLSFNPDTKILEKVFLDLCFYGYLHSVKWLLSVKPNIDVTADNNIAFVRACVNTTIAWSNNYLEIAIYLMSLKPYHYILELDDNHCVVNYKVRDLNEIKWLERRIPLLAFNGSQDNAFKKLNFDVVREICLFV